MLRSPIAPRGSRKHWLAIMTDLPPKLHEHVLSWGSSQGYLTRQEVGLAVFRAFFAWDTEKDEPQNRSGVERRIGPRRQSEQEERDPAA